MWNVRRRHSSHSCQPAAAEPSVKADRREPRQRSERSESLYGRRSGGYTRVSAPGCRFQALVLCFQQVPRPTSAGYSRRNREQLLLPSTTVLSTGSRCGNLQQLCSNPPGVTCRYPADAAGGVALRDAGSDTELSAAADSKAAFRPSAFPANGSFQVWNSRRSLFVFRSLQELFRLPVTGRPPL